MNLPFCYSMFGPPKNWSSPIWQAKIFKFGAYLAIPKPLVWGWLVLTFGIGYNFTPPCCIPCEVPLVNGQVAVAMCCVDAVIAKKGHSLAKKRYFDTLKGWYKPFWTQYACFLPGHELMGKKSILHIKSWFWTIWLRKAFFWVQKVPHQILRRFLTIILFGYKNFGHSAL